jgi:hypothetical protein
MEATRLRSTHRAHDADRGGRGSGSGAVAQNPTVRQCPDCGVPEVRILVDGHARVNLDPISGRCVQCLVQRTHVRVMGHDVKRDAAGDRDDD